MLLVNTDFITGKELETLGIVKGNVVQCRNVGRDFMAGIKTLVGGELKEYTEMQSGKADCDQTHGGRGGNPESRCHYQYPLRVFVDYAGCGGSHRLRNCGEI